jgi:hypothetical protein
MLRQMKKLTRAESFEQVEKPGHFEFGHFCII